MHQLALVYNCMFLLIFVENSLMHSKQGALKRVLAEDGINVDNAVHNIMVVKGIDPSQHPQ